MNTITSTSPRPGDAYMRQWTASSLVQVKACCLFGDNPLYEPTLTNSQLNHWKPTAMKFGSKYIYLKEIHWKYRLQNVRQFVQVSMHELHITGIHPSSIYRISAVAYPSALLRVPRRASGNMAHITGWGCWPQPHGSGRAKWSPCLTPHAPVLSSLSINRFKMGQYHLR